MGENMLKETTQVQLDMVFCRKYDLFIFCNRLHYREFRSSISDIVYDVLLT